MAFKVVFTGGPCSGKTTTLEEFGKLGYRIVPETARDVIETEQKKGGAALPWVDLKAFQEKVFQVQLSKEDALKEYPGVAIFDRGMDGVAYCRLLWVPQGTSFEEFSSKVRSETKGDILQGLKEQGFAHHVSAFDRKRYDSVFYLQSLPYQTDSARKEDPETARRIGQLVLDTYVKFGYDPIVVPPVSVLERIDLIKARIENREK